MDKYDVMRYGMISAVNAEIEGMKAENKLCEYDECVMKYDESAFIIKAEEIRNLVYCHNEQL